MPERRFNPPKPEDISVRKTGFVSKLDTNQKTGEERLVAGDFEPFRGFDREAQSNIYTFGMELTPQSQAEIMERVVEPLRVIAQNHGIEAVFPNHGDIVPHVTFDTARFINLDPNNKQRLATDLDHNLYFTMICRILSGLDFPMNTLVVAPNSYICAGEFTSEFYPLEKARRLIEKVFGQNFDDSQGEPRGLSTIDYRDIFHSSVARITKAPEDRTHLVSFRDEALEEVGESLRSSPISISVARAFHGISTDFIANNGGQFTDNFRN